ncbi:MAG: class I mannose-6-phosphate isomerase [Phycisphaerales bacterium]|nr:class I mannose-6-phosphate isomerase [Phycisphaerales bacterium]|tara:strand:- start:2462 stop:3445 length:984 start_codon:yes stop_codon:yes gene_type:complete
MQLPPLRFNPIMKSKVWGGRKLEHFGKQLPQNESIGESWELSDLPDSIPDGRSSILGGPFDGNTLQDVIEHDAAALLGRVPLSPEGGFPLLLKYLDANDNLSVQVHPDAAYVQKHPEAHLKSEAWHILDAEPGSVIYAGLQPGVDRISFAKSIADGTVVEKLVAIPAVPGECHYLPSGTCHALGAGVLVAEVQTPSDTTFRVWDWGRTSRELHVEQALQCIDFSGRSVCKPRPAAVDSNGLISTCLVDVEHFRIEHIRIKPGSSLEFEDSNAPVAFMILNGEAQLEHGDDTTMLNRGQTILLPAARQACRMTRAVQLELLAVTLQSG